MKYKPKRYDDFWYITTIGTVEQDINDGSWWARMHIRMGNCFLTKAEAIPFAKAFKKMLNDRP